MKKHLFKAVIFLLFSLSTFIASTSTSLAIDGASEYNYTSNADGTVHIFSYLGSNSNVVVPTEINGKRVASIGSYAFSNCPQLQSLTITMLENGVIGNHAFASCPNLTSVTLEGSIASLGSYAFEGTPNLKSVSLSNGLVRIDDHAFDGCYLTSITVPSTVVEVGDRAFMYSKLRSATFLGSDTQIGELAFQSCSLLKRVVLPSNITTIERQTFYDCENLTDIILPDTVTKIGDSAFSGCRDLDCIDFPTGLIEIGNAAFRCTGLYTLVFSNNLSVIGSSAFSTCENLSSVILPNSVTTIKAGAFSGCSKLSSITLSNSLNSIGFTAFSRCVMLKKVTIPSSVTEIELFAFEGCSSLEEVNILSNVVEIDGSIFSQCNSLRTINFSATNQKYMVTDGVLYNKEKTKLVSYLNGRPWNGPFRVPDSVAEIGAYSFGNCHIPTLILPAGIKCIGNSAFGFSTLQNLEIYGDSLIIDPSAFYLCESLTSITLLGSVDSISERAFDSCKKLEMVVFHGPRPFIDPSAYRNCSSALTLFYPVREEQSWSGYTDFYTEAYYSVTLDAQGGESASMIPAPVGSSVNVAAYPATRNGYTFKGWYKEPSCKNAWSFPADRVTTDITLYAKWTANTYTVVYYRNGGDGGSTTSSIHVFDTPMALTANAFTRTGYTFAGWATSATGPVTYADGETVWNLTDANGATVTLYARWAAFATPASPKVASVTYNSVNLTWNTVSGASGYEVWHSTGSSYTLAATVTSTSSTRAGLATGTTYYYKIRAYRTVNGVRHYSLYTAAVSAQPMLAAPTSPKVASVTYNSVNLTWSAVSGAGGYEVWRSTSSGSGYMLAATTAGTSAANTGLATGTTYYYKVRAYRNVNGVKVYGPYSSAVSAKPILAATTGLKVTATTYSSIKLTWNATAGAGGYEVWRSTSSASGYRLAATVAGTNSTSTGLATGTTYYYKVRTYRTVNGVKVYGAYSSVVSAKPMLAATTGLKATAATYNSVKLTWTVTTGAGGYEVWRSTKAASGYLLAATVAGTNSTSTGLATGTTYYYKVRAYRTVNGTKVYGGYSSVVSAKPSLTTPTGVKAARVSATSIKVSWVAVAGAMKYEVWRATSSGGTYYKLPDTTALSYTNTGLTTGKTYYYKVRAYRVVGSAKVYGGYSAVVYAKP